MCHLKFVAIVCIQDTWLIVVSPYYKCLYQRIWLCDTAGPSCAQAHSWNEHQTAASTLLASFVVHPLPLLAVPAHSMFEKLQGLAQGNLRNSRLYYKITAVTFLKELLQASSMNDSKLWKQCQERPMRWFLQTISKWHSWFGAVPCTLFHINKSIILNGISNRNEFFRDYILGVCTGTKPLHLSEAQWECSFCQNFWKLEWRPLAS